MAVACLSLLALTQAAAHSPDQGPPDRRQPPSPGARFGAYVEPTLYTDAERRVAVEGLEARLGHRLRIVHSFHPWTQPFPTDFDRFATTGGRRLLLSWAGTDTRSIARGDDDAMIRERAAALRDLDRPILLRWRWEMNRRNLAQEIHSPADYRAAWRHVRTIFAQERASNVSFVWCPAAYEFTATGAARYYPGDDQVDWVCVDGYSTSPEQPLREVLSPFMSWAAHHDKPVMIGEFGSPAGRTGARAEWLREALRYLRAQTRVRAVVYFSADNTPTDRYSISAEEPTLEVLRHWLARRWLTGPAP